MISIENIDIKPNELKRIEIPPPGILNIKSSFPGYGSLYLLDESGASEWILNLKENTLDNSMAIQPGNYKLVFRSKNAMGSKYSKIRTFTIQSGKTIDLFLN
jgi:Ca-activated chloride channel family protein